jgi:hypothetical protein
VTRANERKIPCVKPPFPSFKQYKILSWVTICNCSRCTWFHAKREVDRKNLASLSSHQVFVLDRTLRVKLHCIPHSRFNKCPPRILRCGSSHFGTTANDDSPALSNEKGKTTFFINVCATKKRRRAVLHRKLSRLSVTLVLLLTPHSALPADQWQTVMHKISEKTSLRGGKKTALRFPTDIWFCHKTSLNHPQCLSTEGMLIS